MAEAEFALESPMATALRGAVQPKLAEYGWTTDADDTTLFEYILAMLVNEKNEATIASELSNDLLDLGPDNLETQQFAHWLFEHIAHLRNQLAGAGSTDAEVNMVEMQNDASPATMSHPGQDQDMEGVADNTSANMYGPVSSTPPSSSQGATARATHLFLADLQGTYTHEHVILPIVHFARSICTHFNPLISFHRPPPTGPKAMRNGSGSASGSGAGANRTGRGRAMRDQLNQHMDRSGDALHRIRGTSGTGRINSHSREPPRGPRAAQVGRGMAAMANGRGGNMNGPMGMGHGAMTGMNSGMNVASMPPMPMPPMGQNGMNGMLNPQQQMALMQMYEQQAQMMQQIFSGQTPTSFVNPGFQQNNRNGRGGKPLIDRVDKRQNKFNKKSGQDETTRCTKPDCPFVHQSPAAPEGTTVDMSSTCSFGAACMNRKCASKHPSPAQRQQFKSEQDCMFFPNCRDGENCPYKHPSMPPCRNGADCTTPGCKFYHNPTMCKYTPCTNRYCIYKHAEGQKKTFKNMEWHAPKTGDEDTKDDHVSERKFVADEEAEELIIPEKTETVDAEITA
jgi:nuclear polyadenylated RNA-binding protein NAB2